jgi:hypothetical protein
MLSLFGCSHVKTTFSITLKGAESAPSDLPRTYIVCLDCGKELSYSWAKMEVVRKAWFIMGFPAGRFARRFGTPAGGFAYSRPDPSSKLIT